MKSKYCAHRKDKLVNIKDIGEELNVIEESNGDYYITRTGKVYTDYGNDMYYPMKVFKILRPHDKTKGYWYVNIKDKNNKMVGRRLHVLLAKAFIPNPNNYPCVMHLDDDGFNYELSNLRWGTISENTKMGFDNGKSHNDKGFDDSQSIPVNQYDTLTGSLIKEFGSIKEAAREVGVYSYDTDIFIGRAFNIKRAAEMVGEKPRNAQEDIYKGRKPQRKFKKRDYYFKQIPTLFSDQRDEVKTDA